jgi:alanine racemase
VTTIETYKNRPTRAEISLSHLRNNLSIVKSFIQPTVKIMAMVKANAYGHGLFEVSTELLKQGVHYLGVAYLEEGIFLRQQGVTAPILALGAINKGQIAEFIYNDIEITSSSLEKSKAISAIAKDLKKNAKVHLKIDTGMERIGVHWYNAEHFIEESVAMEGLQINGLCSHFAKAESDPHFTALQLQRFDDAITLMDRGHILPSLVHIANSAGIMNHPESHYTMVRPGILLYGYNPFGYNPTKTFDGKTLQPVMTLKTKVAYFKVVPAETGISYNHTYTTADQTRVVTLPIGYGDGYMRRLSNIGKVIIRGKQHPIAGNICMDQCMVDIGTDGTAYNGDDVLLFGSMDGMTIPLESLCDSLGTVTYEFLCGISARVPRIYLNQ